LGTQNSRFVRYSSHSELGIVLGCIDLIKQVYQFRHAVIYISKIQITRKYVDSSLGVLWSLVTPLLMLLPLAIILPLFVRFNLPNYVVYLFSGILCWGLMTTTMSDSSTSIIEREQLIKRAYIPSIIFPLVVVIKEFVNMIMALVAFFVLSIVLNFTLNLKPLYMLGTLTIILFFCIGLGMILSIATVYFRDSKQIQAVIMRSLFFATPIIYPVSVIPETYRFWYNCNPFFHMVELFRYSIYTPETPGFGIFAVPLVVTLITLFIGLAMYWRFGRAMIFRL